MEREIREQRKKPISVFNLRVTKQKPSFSIYSFFLHILLPLRTGHCYSKGATEFISLVQALIKWLLPASIGKAEKQHCCCLFSIGKKLVTMNGLALLSRKLVQHPNPHNSRKIYSRILFKEYAGRGDSSMESISLKSGLCETWFGNLKGLFSQEYTLPTLT